MIVLEVIPHEQCGQTATVVRQGDDPRVVHRGADGGAGAFAPCDSCGKPIRVFEQSWVTGEWRAFS